MKKFHYKRLSINPRSGQVSEFNDSFEHATPNKPITSLNALGEDGWEIIACEYYGTKAANGGELKSESIWIAKKEIDEQQEQTTDHINNNKKFYENITKWTVKDR